MNKFKFYNKAGWVKFNYRRNFWLFGEKMYHITGVIYTNGYARKTIVKYYERESAIAMYSVMKNILEKESNKIQ